jgi:FkbM family methyltransferase
MRRLKTILDVGANVGQTAVELVRYFPDSEIHCFEPAIEPFEILKSRAAQWPNVLVYRLALGDHRSELELMVRSGSFSELNTFVLDSWGRDVACRKETVTVETIDEFCAEKGIFDIDILKLDVQGWEMKVLAGATELFSRNGVKFVFTEAAFKDESKEMVSFAEMHARMTKLGFVLSGIYDCFRWGTKAEIYFCNCLYVNQHALDGGHAQ